MLISKANCRPTTKLILLKFSLYIIKVLRVDNSNLRPICSLVSKKRSLIFLFRSLRRITEPIRLKFAAKVNLLKLIWCRNRCFSNGSFKFLANLLVSFCKKWYLRFGTCTFLRDLPTVDWFRLPSTEIHFFLRNFCIPSPKSKT